jgi:hypothetical protein
MRDPLPEAVIQKLWQSQSETISPLPVEALRYRVRRLRTSVKAWLAWELMFFALVLILFGRAFLHSQSQLFRLGCLLGVAGFAFALWQLAVRAFLKPLPVNLVAATWLDFHRRALERQRDAFLSAWKWLLLPLLPGMLVTQIATHLAHPNTLPHLFVLDAMVFIFAAGWRFAAGKMIQRRISKLDNDSN